jgi:hypothetical protein
MFELLLPLFYLLVFNLIILRCRFFHLPVLGFRASLLAYNLKIVSGIIIWFIYTYYYTDRITSDQYKYFDDAVILFEAFKIHTKYFLQLFFDLGRNDAELIPFYEQLMNWDKQYNYSWLIDNRTIIRTNALICFFSLGNFHIHTLFMNFISFSGLSLLYKSVFSLFKTKSKLLFTTVFFMPTVLFWGSGVLKEGILIFGLGLFCFAFFQLMNENFNLKNTTFLILGILVLASIKVYVLLCLFPATITYFLIKKLNFKNVGLAFLLIQVVTILIVFNLKWISPELDIVNKLWFKRNDFVNVAIDWNAKSKIPALSFEKSAVSILIHSPQAIFNTLCRPHIFEIKSALHVMPLLENLGLLMLIIFMILNFKKPNREEQYFIIFALVFIIYLAVMIGLVTPILGAIIRYKLPLMPFILMVIFTFTDTEKLIRKYPFIKMLV